ncbi:hypothetical protein BY996DRAFT_4582538 [Phakopsora pachyrhizi]|nr:hypothetical protein BY996DRAFT_4582538 [Phakopsora pachyrhizi]
MSVKGFDKRALLLIIFGYNSFISCHGFIKSWSPDDGKTWILGQKQHLEKSSIRSFSENTGWIGSNFLTSPAIVCGSSKTPSQRVAPPSGEMFSQADQSAGKTLPVESGATVRLLINDEEGKVYPHNEGHIQAYLGRCGDAENSCQNFDAAAIGYFKILSEKDGLASTKIFPYNKAKDGNVLKKEGKQDQYYVTCGQISLSEPKSTPAILLQAIPVVKFPGAYKNGNLELESKLPGPRIFEGFSTDKKGAANQRNSNGSDSSQQLTPRCAVRCLQKISTDQEQGLFDVCHQKEGQAPCQCQNKQFVKAFFDCSQENCKGECELENGIAAFDIMCKVRTGDNFCHPKSKKDDKALA